MFVAEDLILSPKPFGTTPSSNPRGFWSVTSVHEPLWMIQIWIRVYCVCERGSSFLGMILNDALPSFLMILHDICLIFLLSLQREPQNPPGPSN